MKNKKGITGAISIFVGVAVVAVMFVIVGIILTFGADITDDIGEEQVPLTGIGCNQSTTLRDSCPLSYNISIQSLEGQEELGSWQDNWAMIIAVVVIISLLGLALGSVLMYVRSR